MRFAGPLACRAWLAIAGHAGAGELTLYEQGGPVAAIVHEDQKTYALAAQLLGRDLRALSGQTPRISSRLQDCGKTCVIIGAYDTPLLRRPGPNPA